MRARSSAGGFVVCVENKGYPVSLELRKIYQAMPDPGAARHGLVRVIDESGEDYLYPRDFFVPVDLPTVAGKLLPFPGRPAPRQTRDLPRDRKRAVRTRGVR
jgi:hypothetical protein